MTHRCGLGGVKECGEIPPILFPCLPGVHHPCKSTFEVVLLGKRAEVFCGKSRCPRSKNLHHRQRTGRRPRPLPHSQLPLPPVPNDGSVRYTAAAFCSQLIRRTAGSIDMIVPGIIHLGLHDQIIIEVHFHHSFRVGVIFIFTSDHLIILLHHCQYAVIIKITSKRKRRSVHEISNPP